MVSINAILTPLKKKNVKMLDGPILDKITTHFDDTINFDQYPFSLPLIKNLGEIECKTQVTFFVGENGSGKSTILEAIAQHIGFGPEGGSKNIHFKTSDEKTYLASSALSKQLRLSWRQKPKNGYFFRAESFFNIANHIDLIARDDPSIYSAYGGKSLHEQSHGESFLTFFQHRIETDGFFILDEPEAALSPQRQLTLLSIIHEVCKHPFSQFLIATHSPLLLAYPEATIYSCDSSKLTAILYEETVHYQITRHFLNNPQAYLKHLLEN